jgi:hypothetical protein
MTSDKEQAMDRSKRAAGAALIGVLLGIAAPAQAIAQNNCTPVTFERGRSSATLRGTAPPEDIVCYTFAAGAGKTAHLSVSGRNMIVSVIGVGDARESWTFKTTAQTYKFVVGQMMRSVTPEPYSVTLSLTGAAVAAATAGKAHFDCPPSLDGRKLLNWNVFDGPGPGARNVYPTLKGDGSADALWIISPAQAASGNVRIRCGYDHTEKVVEFRLTPAIHRCISPELSHGFDCE